MSKLVFRGSYITREQKRVGRILYISKGKWGLYIYTGEALGGQFTSKDEAKAAAREALGG